MNQITMRLPEDMAYELAWVAEAEDVSVAEVARRAIAEHCRQRRAAHRQEAMQQFGETIKRRRKVLP
jgi:predicted transcriptional regulator